MMSPLVKIYEGDENGGIESLRRAWHLPQETSTFFQALQQVLENGGRFTKTGKFIAPYWHTNFPGDWSDLEIFDYVVVHVRDAPILRAQNKAAARIGTAGYQMFKYVPGERGWYQITLPDGRIGFIETRFAAPAAGPYGHFRKVSGRWKLDVFSEGLIP